MTGRDEGPRGPAVLLLLLAYPVLWFVLEEASTRLAFWPVALRFLLLWSLPARQWPAVVAVDCVASALARHWFWNEPLDEAGLWLVSLAPVALYAGMIALVRGRRPAPDPETPARMVQLLGAGALSAFAVAPVLGFYFTYFRDRPSDGLDQLLAFGFGDLFGLVVVAPVVLALRGDAWALWRSRRWAFEAALAFSVTLGVMSLARQRPALDEHLLLIVFLPTVVLAFRHGWRGAAWALSVLGLLLALGFSDHPDPMRLQVMTAVIGGAALLLGAAASQLRAHRETVEAQHAALRLSMLEQRELAARIVALEDEGQRHVAESLHEQVAPPLQELRTLLAMAWRSSGDERDARLLETLRGHTWQVQDGLERALRRLQPPSLARGDLQALLAHGPLWEWAQEQGARWTVELQGPLQDVPERWKVQLYRIAQAGLEQGLSLGATEYVLRLQAQPSPGALDIELQLDIEFATPIDRASLGINAIQDRTLAAGGQYRCEHAGRSCRHSVRFEGVLVAPR